MTIIRRWSPEGFGNVTFEAPFYNQLLSAEEKGCLSRDLECHALWDYYVMACVQYKKAKDNYVEESELSEVFDRTRAQALFRGCSNKHGVKPHAMCRFWPLVEKQVRALGGTDELPEQFKFKHWGN